MQNYTQKRAKMVIWGKSVRKDPYENRIKKRIKKLKNRIQKTYKMASQNVKNGIFGEKL